MPNCHGFVGGRRRGWCCGDPADRPAGTLAREVPSRRASLPALWALCAAPLLGACAGAAPSPPASPTASPAAQRSLAATPSSGGTATPAAASLADCPRTPRAAASLPVLVRLGGADDLA